MDSGISELNDLRLLHIIVNPIFLSGLALLVALHQYLFYGKWFEWTDIHHETFMIALVFAALILIVLKGGSKWV